MMYVFNVLILKEQAFADASLHNMLENHLSYIGYVSLNYNNTRLIFNDFSDETDYLLKKEDFIQYLDMIKLNGINNNILTEDIIEFVKAVAIEYPLGV